MDFDAEPLPISQGRASIDLPTDWPVVTSWSRRIQTPEGDFWSVLNRRRSDVGEAPTDIAVQSLLWHATLLRFRSQTGRFGTWESRSAPSPGGLHAIRILVLPIDKDDQAGIYDDKVHGLRASGDISQAADKNRDSILNIVGATQGITLQLIANIEVYASCYRNFESLVWRESGALGMTIALCATALSLSSTTLGRHGADVTRAVGLPSNWRGVGAVHVTAGSR